LAKLEGDIAEVYPTDYKNADFNKAVQELVDDGWIYEPEGDWIRRSKEFNTFGEFENRK
jgi:hypothetical protein